MDGAVLYFFNLICIALSSHKFSVYEDFLCASHPHLFYLKHAVMSCSILLLIHVSCPISLFEKVRRTVRGSADDIGWLQQAADMPPVEDGTERFMEILDDIR